MIALSARPVKTEKTCGERATLQSTRSREGKPPTPPWGLEEAARRSCIAPHSMRANATGLRSVSCTGATMKTTGTKREL